MIQSIGNVVLILNLLRFIVVSIIELYFISIDN